MTFGLIGEKLIHSYSPEIHAAIADYDYELKEVKPSELEGFLLKRDFKGINVTIPYKIDAIPYLDEISGDAKKIGAVNTIINKDGRLFGYNTDYDGVHALLKKMAVDVRGKKALILGTGGTSKTVKAVLEDLEVRELYKVSRSGGCSSSNYQGTLIISYEEAAHKHADADIIINTTPCGMFPNENIMPISLDSFTNLEAVVDVIYNPLRTKLVLEARKRGIKAEGGLYMLAAQGAVASRIFKESEEKEPPAPKNEIDCSARSLASKNLDILAAYSFVLSAKENIVLIGMPSCGKTSIGTRLSKLTGKSFIDSDIRLEETTGLSAGDYIQKYGEAAFRDEEEKTIAEICKTGGQIIATGGGAILRQSNIDAMKSNGRVFFIDRSLDLLKTTDDRPLSSSREALKKRYNERIDIYTNAADIIVPGDGTVEEVAQWIVMSNEY